MRRHRIFGWIRPIEFRITSARVSNRGQLRRRRGRLGVTMCAHLSRALPTVTKSKRDGGLPSGELPLMEDTGLRMSVFQRMAEKHGAKRGLVRISESILSANGRLISNPNRPAHWN